MKKNAMYYITIILTILFILVSTYSYAAEITKEDLKTYFEKLSNKTLSVTYEVTDTEIIWENVEYIQKIKYDLTNKPTFTFNITFKEGMSYIECIDEGAKLVNHNLGFTAVAEAKGIEEGYASSYFFARFIESEYQTTMNNIKKEDFTNAIEYAQKTFDKDFIMMEDELCTLSIKKGILNENEYIVESQLVINSEKDFAIIKEVVKDAEIVTNNTTTNTTTTNNVTTPTPLPTSSTANIVTMPNAGFEINALNILKVVLGLSLAGVIVYSIYNKRYSSK